MNPFRLARSGPVFLGLVLPALVPCSPASAGQLPDQGTFRILIDGREAGEEEFVVQRSGPGARARGTLTMRDGRTVTTFLDLVGPGLRLNVYRAAAAGPDTAAVYLAARADGHLDSRMTGPWGEEAREYRVRPSTIVLDDGMAHHYFVLAPVFSGPADGVLHAVAPLARREDDAMAVEVVADTIRIDGETIDASRVRIGAGESVRSAWFDGGGRLVQVAFPARGFLAQRLRAPAGTRGRPKRGRRP